MRIRVIKGTIKRRLLVNFRADPQFVQRLLPQPFRPKLHRGYSVVGICLIRLEQMRAAGLPRIIGFSSENAAHRVAVEWNDEIGTLREGVFVPRRDTGAIINRLAAELIFPGARQISANQILASQCLRAKLVTVRIPGAIVWPSNG